MFQVASFPAVELLRLNCSLLPDRRFNTIVHLGTLTHWRDTAGVAILLGLVSYMLRVSPGDWQYVVYCRPNTALLVSRIASFLSLLTFPLVSLTSGDAPANNGTGEAEGGGGGGLTPGPEATPRARLGHGHVKSASISAGSGNSQSTITNREAAASASAAERSEASRWSARCAAQRIQSMI